MKFAVCNELFQDWPLERAFAFAHECGYQGIELAPFTLGTDAYQISRQQRKEVAELARGHQLQVVGLHWLLAKTEGYHLTSPDLQVRRRTADYLAELVRLCRELGGDLLVFGSPQQRNRAPGVSTEQAMDYAAEVIGQVTGELERQRVTLALEPLGPEEGNFLLTARSAIELAQRTGSPWVRLHLDVKAMSSESEPIPKILQDSAEYLVHFHANDPNRRGPGMGTVDFHPIFAALEMIGYHGWVSVEVFDYSPGVEVLARESLRYMQACLEDLERARDE